VLLETVFSHVRLTLLHAITRKCRTASVWGQIMVWKVATINDAKALNFFQHLEKTREVGLSCHDVMMSGTSKGLVRRVA
jgi:hypothetical protein